MIDSLLTPHAGAWMALALLGIYHGLNPGMGWLFAVSNGMQERRTRGVFRALPPLAAGHLLSMLAVLLPFAALSAYSTHFTAIRIATGALLIGFGVYKLINRRHPRWLARIGPGHLVTWSFLMATAHGAGLMLAPVYLDLRAAPDPPAGHAAAMASMPSMASMPMPAAPSFVSNAAMAALVSLVHAAIMIATAGAVAWLVYRYFGLRFLNRAWVNLDLVWAAFLIVVGGIAAAGVA